jgi:hypothetical protein
MFTAAKLAANRANAMKSTGPRTLAGKARAAQNARRHGLRAVFLPDEGFTQEVKDLARLIAGDGAPEEVFALACRVAETQLDYVRIKQIRVLAMREDPGFTKTPEKTIRRVAAIDRHQGRASSRRIRAVRAFGAGCSENLWAPPPYDQPKATKPAVPTGERAGHPARTNPPSAIAADAARANSNRPNEATGDVTAARSSQQIARTNPNGPNEPTGGAQS